MSHRADARQRHRLFCAGASASVSLNTSALYIGQAIGGFLYARDLFYALGYVATALVAQAVIAMILTKPRKGRGA